MKSEQDIRKEINELSEIVVLVSARIKQKCSLNGDKEHLKTLRTNIRLLKWVLL